MEGHIFWSATFPGKGCYPPINVVSFIESMHGMSKSILRLWFTMN